MPHSARPLSSSHRPPFPGSKQRRAILAASIGALLGLCVAPRIAQAQLLVFNGSNANVAEYNSSTGALIKTNFTSGLTASYNMTVAGNSLFVSDYIYNTITQYDATTGATVADPFVTTGASNAGSNGSGFSTLGVAVAGNSLFAVFDNATPSVQQYNATTGALINAGFVTGLGTGASLAVGGNYLLVGDWSTNSVTEYDTTTGVKNTGFSITGLSRPENLIVSGGHVYVVSYTSGTVGEYDATTGAAINANFITGLNGPIGITISGNTLYVSSNAGNVVGTYDAATGTAINAHFLTVGSPGPLAFANAAAPATYWLGSTSGAWTAANWASDSSGTTTTATPTNSDAVTFSATGATHLATTLGANFTIKSLTIGSASAVTINAGGSYSLTVSGSAGTGINVQAGAGLFTLNANLALNASSDTIAVNNTAGAVINGVISGGNGLTKTGTGALTLGAANTYTGGTNISGGIIFLGIADALPTATNLSVTGALDLAGYNQQVASVTGSGIVTNSGAAATFTVNNATADSFAGTITGANLSLTKSGAGTLTLSSANTYGGTTTISAGTIADGIANALPTMTALAVTGTLDLAGYDQQMASVSGSGIVTNGGAAATFTVNNAATDSFDGTFTGTNLSLTKSGAGTLTLTGASTYGGTTTISAGTIADGIANALPTATALAVAGTLDLAGYNQQVASVSGSGVVTDSGAAATFTVSNATADSFAGSISGANLSLTKSGAGTLTLSSANTYGGSTTISAGTIADGIANALPTTTALSVTGTLDLAGFNQQVAGVTGSGVVTDSGAAATFTVNNAAADNFAGTFTGTNLALTKSGAGTLTLAAASTYGGATTISAGTIANGIANALPTATALSVTGTFDLAGYNQQVASVTGAGTVTDSGAAATFTVNNATADNFAGSITGTNLSLTKSSTGTLTLTAGNTYGGGTQISGGTLLANNATGQATGSGLTTVNSGGTLGGNGTVAAVALNSGGTLAPNAAATLHANSLTWSGGGQLNLGLGTTSNLLALTGALTKQGTGAYTINITDTGGIGNASAYTLVTFGSTTFSAGDFTLSLPTGYSAGLLETSTQLVIALAFSATGNTIQNGPGAPPIADFTVGGLVGTSGGNNTLNSLIFTPGGTLTVSNTLTLTSGKLTTSGGTNTIIGGTISGPGGLHIDVNGNLLIGSTLIGNITKTGGGSLFLDGALFGDMSVLQGLLGGNGSILGNLFSAATISPGHSPGHIQVSGNFSQLPAGLLQIQIGGRDITQHDLLSVGGVASLGGALQLERLNGFKLKRGQPVTFLTAGQGVNGQFATVISDFTSDTILEPTVVYHANSVALEAVQGSFETFAQNSGLTPNQKSVARALDSVAFRNSPPKVIDYLDNRKLDKLPGDFEQIAPEELTSMFTIGTSLAKVQSQNIQRRTDDIRSGSSGFSAASLAVNGAGPSYSGSFSFGAGLAGPNGDGKEVKETKQVIPEENRWGTFLSGTGEWVSVGNTDNARGYDLDSGGFTLGIDYKVTPNFAIGLMAGYTGTSADLVDRGRVYVNGGKIGLYATFFQNEQATQAPTMSKDSSKEAPAPAPGIAKGFYADMAVTGGYNSYDTRRSALQGEARGNTDGGELNALAGIGYDFKAGGLTFGPTASFNYTYLGTNAFTEHGSLAPLNIHGGKGESLRTALGFKASYDWKVGGILIKPEIRAAWQHEYGDSAYELGSNFANGGGDSFTVNGPELGRDSVLLGAGFAIEFTERMSTYFYYDGELGRTNYQSNSVTGGFRYAF